MPTQTSLVTGVDFVAVPITDYEASAEFYGNVLGLPFVKRWGQLPAGEFQAGNLTLAVVQPDGFGIEYKPGNAWAARRVDDVAAARADLEAKGIEFRMDTIDSGVCHQAIFADPDGNTLILHHRYAPKGARPPASKRLRREAPPRGAGLGRGLSTTPGPSCPPRRPRARASWHRR